MAVINLDKFVRQVLDSAEQEVPNLVRNLQTKIGFAALKGVVLKTPVDTGRARGNWQVGINSAPDSSKLTKDKDGGGVIGAGGAIIVGADAFVRIFLTNNVEYIEVLDRGLFDPPSPGPSKDKREGRTGELLVQGGFSTQAPAGMVDVTAKEIEAMFR